MALVLGGCASLWPHAAPVPFSQPVVGHAMLVEHGSMLAIILSQDGRTSEAYCEGGRQAEIEKKDTSGTTAALHADPAHAHDCGCR